MDAFLLYDVHMLVHATSRFINKRQTKTNYVFQEAERSLSDIKIDIKLKKQGFAIASFEGVIKQSVQLP